MRLPYSIHLTIDYLSIILWIKQIRKFHHFPSFWLLMTIPAKPLHYENLTNISMRGKSQLFPFVLRSDYLHLPIDFYTYSRINFRIQLSSYSTALQKVYYTQKRKEKKETNQKNPPARLFTLLCFAIPLCLIFFSN